MIRVLLVFLFLTACQSAPLPDFRSQTVTIQSRGVAVPATWVTPIQSANPIPVVIMAHGHGGSRDEAGGFSQVAVKLAAKGIASIRIDFPGCGDSSESFAHNNLGNMLDDLHAARAYVLAQPGIDPRRVGLLGYSIGGRLAMLESEQNDYRAIALWAPVGDNGAGTMIRLVGGNEAWRALKADARLNGATDFTTDWGQQQRLGFQWFIDLEQSDPLQAIARFAGPVLVVQGGRDKVVLPEVAAAVIDRAISSAYTSYRTITGAGHGLGFYDAPGRYGGETISLTVSFLARTL